MSLLAEAEDINNWRDHDGVVHALGEFSLPTTYWREHDGQRVDDYIAWWLTACGIRLDEKTVPPVYVDAPLTCLICIGDLDA